MTRPIHRRLRLPLTLGVALLLSATLLVADSATPLPGKPLRIEPSSTRAGIAKVHLRIEDLRQTGESLEGTYRIRVPLWPRENDTGQVVLHAAPALDDPARGVTTMTGRAVSTSGEVNQVVAQVRPDGVVKIRVFTPKRTLKFTSRFVSR